MLGVVWGIMVCSVLLLGPCYLEDTYISRPRKEKEWAIEHRCDEVAKARFADRCATGGYKRSVYDCLGVADDLFCEDLAPNSPKRKGWVYVGGTWRLIRFLEKQP